MIIPLRTDSPLRSTPWMNWAIIAANVIVFVVERRNPALEIEWALNPRDPHLTDYLTYMWLHANVGHLVMNMLFLYIFGNNVNDRMGHIGYLGFYLAGGVFAGVGHAFTQSAPVVGASGAVAAVTGAYLVLFPRSSITVIYLLFFIGTIEIPSMWFVAFFFVKDVVLNFSAEPTGTAHMAHVFGTLFGFGVCFALLSVQLLPRDQFDVVALVQRWNKRRQYREMVSRGYDPFGYIPPTVARGEQDANAPPDPAMQKIQDLRAEISEAVAHHNHPRAALLFQELKRLDPQQVLSRQAQLEVANQLASQQLYHEAADAYEQFIKHYSNFEQIEQVELMLGLIYARYLDAYEPAREYLLRAMARLHGDREVSMARTELARIEALLGPRAKK